MNRSEVIAEIRAIRDRADRLLVALEAPRDAPARHATEDPDPAAPRPFVGRALESRYDGKCVVCGRPYTAGENVIYNGELKKTAHVGCGQRDARDLRGGR